MGVILSVLAWVLLVSCNQSPRFSELKADNSLIKEQSLALAPTASDKLVVSTFFDFAQMSRPSLGEGPERDYLIGLAEAANTHAGREVIRHAVDGSGNVIFRLEGTGRFIGKTAPSVALQGHMDMAWAVAGIPAGSDLTPYFENGIELALDQDWLQAKDLKTSIGADNGFGVSMAARYMIEFTEEHPPMELLFTVGEEKGMVGSRGLEHVVSAPVMINLDSFYADTFVYGCLGNQRAFVSTSFATQSDDPERVRLTLRLTDLRGGHSGHDIAKPRLNAIKTIMALVTPLNDVRLVSADGGTEAGLGSIPTSAALVVSLPAAGASAAADAVRANFEHARLLATDETSANLSVEIGVVPVEGRTLNSEDSRRVVSAFNSFVNGPIDFSSDAPTGVDTSANLAYLKLASDDVYTATLKAGFMARSYVLTSIESTVAANAARLATWSTDPALSTRDVQPMTQPWLANLEAPLYVSARNKFPSFHLTRSSGTNELALLSAKLPEVEMLSIGVLILDAHSPRERISLNSVFEMNAALSTLVSTLGDQLP